MTTPTPARTYALNIIRSVLDVQINTSSTLSATSLPLLRLYKSANDLFTQAECYAAESDEERAYILYTRYAEFFVKVIMKHSNYAQASYVKEREMHRKSKWRNRS